MGKKIINFFLYKKGDQNQFALIIIIFFKKIRSAGLTLTTHDLSLESGQLSSRVLKL
jgi:hypothetical protein